MKIEITKVDLSTIATEVSIAMRTFMVYVHTAVNTAGNQAAPTYTSENISQNIDINFKFPHKPIKRIKICVKRISLHFK